MFFLVSKFSYIRFEGDKRSLEEEISGSWILYRMGYNGFYSIFVYTGGAGRILLSCCKAGACRRVFVAASMDRNYHGVISPSHRARSASGSIVWKRMFFFCHTPDIPDIQTFGCSFCHTRARDNEGDLLAALCCLLNIHRICLI
jgi:hypothetical protein